MFFKCLAIKAPGHYLLHLILYSPAMSSVVTLADISCLISSCKATISLSSSSFSRSSSLISFALQDNSFVHIIFSPFLFFLEGSPVKSSSRLLIASAHSRVYGLDFYKPFELLGFSLPCEHIMIYSTRYIIHLVY